MNCGRFYPKYYAAAIGDIGSKEQRKFSGKKLEYPMFRIGISATIDDEKPRSILKSAVWKQNKRIKIANASEVQERKERVKSRDNPNERKRDPIIEYTKRGQSQHVLCVFQSFSNHNIEDGRQFLEKVLKKGES